MPKIKFSHVVSCSSEDPIHPSENLLNVDPKKKFLCKTKGEPSVSTILQFEKSCRICGIDVAYANSAFVEIFAGRSSSKEENYEIILPMSSFMTPMDAMNMTNCNRVRMFTADDLSAAASQEKWDRVKIVCTQPFNKNIPYGLTFVAFSSKDEDVADFGKFRLRAASPVTPKPGVVGGLHQEAKTIAREIRTATTPECAKISIRPGSSKKVDVSEDELKKQMNRNNRQDLFYDSDDDRNSGKVDKVVELVKLRQQEQEKKAENGGKNPTNDKKNDRKKQKTNENDTKQKTNETNDRRKEKTNEKQNGAGASVKRTSTNENSVKKRQKTAGKLFNELLSDVVFTISGFVNPERANIRQNGLNMGAKYRKDWDNSCTHLICAFANTPKFQQVRGKGKIIRKEWLYDCNSQRRRLPWRRYALDKNDQNQSESEDEICEKIDGDVGRSPSDYLSGSDTDEEIQKIIKLQETSKKGETDKKIEIDENKEKDEKDEAFEIETDEETLEKNTKNIPDVPKLFNTDIFYIDSVFSEKETEKLERLIKSFNGAVMKRISAIIDFVVTDAESVENLKNRIFGAKFVTKDWIFECHDQMVLVPYDNYVLN